MEVLSRKTEKEKLAELEAMLADATCSGDVTDDASSVSFDSEVPAPSKHHFVPPSPRQDGTANSTLAWRSGDWSRSGNNAVDINSSSDMSMIDNSLCGAAAGGREAADVTAQIYSSSSSNSAASSREEVVARKYEQETHHRHTPSFASHARRVDGRRIDGRRRRRRATPEGDETAATVVLLTKELVLARSQMEQKDVVTRSLQRQLDQRGEIEEQTQARAEEDLVAALAKASGLKEELARTSQLLMDGANARQQLEQRCSLLTQDLHKSVARTAELEDEVSASRAELVRISGALHARRGTDVVDAERAFGEELQRLQDGATREARSLRQEASCLRASLEQSKTILRKACGERDSWREEADALSSEAATLRETVQALRQYSENDTIDQLLKQVSRWKRRAEELENLRQVSSSERSASDGCSSETELSRCTTSMEPLVSPRTEGGAPLAAVDPATTPPRKEEHQHEGLVGGGEEATIHALRQELVRAKETLMIKEGEVAAAVLAAREQTAKRVEAESRVKNLQRESEAIARAAREDVVVRRAAKARDMANLKIAIQQDLVDELHKLQREVREQQREEQSHGTEEGTQCAQSGDTSVRKPLGVDKACQVDDSITSSPKRKGVEVHNGTLARGADSANSAADRSSVVASPKATAVLEDDAEKQVSAALTSAAVAQMGATAWASAFSVARHLFHAALVSLCEQANDVLGVNAEGNGRQALVVPPVAGVIVPGSNEASSAVIPWAPSEAKAQAAYAIKVLRDRVDSSVERIRLALTVTTAGTPKTPGSPTDSATAVSQTTTGSQTVVPAVVPLVTNGSQTDKEESGEAFGSPRHDVGVQAGRLGGWGAGADSSAGGGGGAPAWERGMNTRYFEGGTGDGDRERRRKSKDDARMEELERKAGVLSAALQRAEEEKGNLEQSLRRQFEREKAMQLKKQRDQYEADIGALHASTMALVQDFQINSVA